MSGFDFYMIMASCDADADFKKLAGANFLNVLSAID